MMTAGPDGCAGWLHAAGERITVALILAAADDLGRLQERAKLPKTDLAHGAIISDELFEARLRAGRDLLVRDNATGETRLVRLPLADVPEGQAAPRAAREPAITGRGKAMIVRTGTYCKNELPGILWRLAKARSAGLPCCVPLTVTMMGQADRMIPACVIAAFALIAMGVVLGAVAIVCIGIRREEKAMSLARPAPGRMANGARAVTGFSSRGLP